MLVFGYLAIFLICLVVVCLIVSLAFIVQFARGSCDKQGAAIGILAPAILALLIGWKFYSVHDFQEVRAYTLQVECEGLWQLIVPRNDDLPTVPVNVHINKDGRMTSVDDGIQIMEFHRLSKGLGSIKWPGKKYSQSVSLVIVSEDEMRITGASDSIVAFKLVRLLDK